MRVAIEMVIKIHNGPLVETYLRLLPPLIELFGKLPVHVKFISDALYHHVVNFILVQFLITYHFIAFIVYQI